MMNICILDVTEETGTPMAQKEMREIRTSQRSDPLIERWRIAVTDNRLPPKMTDRETMGRHFKSFQMKSGVVYKDIEENEEKKEQLVLPQCYRQEVLMGLHNHIRDPGKDRTLTLLKDRVY